MITKVKRAIGIGAGISIYSGLAILGGGGVGQFFSEPARAVLVLVMIALSAAALFTDASLSRGVREDRGNRWVIAAFAVIGALSAWIPAARAFGRSTVITAGGRGSHCSRAAAFCACGPCSCWAADSSAWWQFNPGTSLSPAASPILRTKAHGQAIYEHAA